jgi:hypothetical protein
MKAHWAHEDYVIMLERHSLPFAPEDVQYIREGLAQRITSSPTN